MDLTVSIMVYIKDINYATWLGELSIFWMLFIFSYRILIFWVIISRKRSSSMLISGGGGGGGDEEDELCGIF